MSASSCHGVRLLSVVVAAVLGTAWPLSSQEPVQPPTETPAAAPATSASAYDDASLGPGDAVRIVIYRQPDVSGEYMVDEAGFLVLPLVGPVEAVNRSVGELEAELVTRFQKFYRDPVIVITPLYRVNVLGYVGKPGLFPVDPTMTISDVLALAGGITPQGSYKKIHMLRSGQEQTLDLSSPEKRAQQVGQLGLRSGDQIVVGEKGRSVWEHMPIVASAVGLVATVIALTR